MSDIITLWLQGGISNRKVLQCYNSHELPLPLLGPGNQLHHQLPLSLLDPGHQLHQQVSLPILRLYKLFN